MRDATSQHAGLGIHATGERANLVTIRVEKRPEVNHVRVMQQSHDLKLSVLRERRTTVSNLGDEKVARDPSRLRAERPQRQREVGQAFIRAIRSP